MGWSRVKPEAGALSRKIAEGAMRVGGHGAGGRQRVRLEAGGGEGAPESPADRETAGKGL